MCLSVFPLPETLQEFLGNAYLLLRNLSEKKVCLHLHTTDTKDFALSVTAQSTGA